MTEKKFEMLSAVMDGEMEPTQATLEQIGQDDSLRQGWSRYHLIRAVIQDRQAPDVYADLQAQVSTALQNEATILAPKRKRFSAKGFAKQATGMAIAATIATIAVVTVQNGTVEQNETGQIAAVDKAQTTVKVQPKDALQTVSTKEDSRLSSDLEARLSGYLVNHNEFTGSASVRIMPAYSRIVSITPGERVIDE